MNGSIPAGVQDAFLSQLCRDKTPVTVYLMNGFQVRGVLEGFDDDALLIMQEQKQQLVYKHAVSTVSPQGPGAVVVISGSDGF